MWPDTRKGEGEDGGYRLVTAEDSDNHEPPLGERVGFSESPKGKHPDPEKEIGASRIQRACSPAQGYEHAERSSTERKRKTCKNHSLFPCQNSKFSITEKWHMGCFVSQKMNTLLAGMALSNHRARWTTKRFYKEYTIYPVKITSLCWNLRWFLEKK